MEDEGVEYRQTSGVGEISDRKALCCFTINILKVRRGTCTERGIRQETVVEHEGSEMLCSDRRGGQNCFKFLEFTNYILRGHQ